MRLRAATGVSKFSVLLLAAQNLRRNVAHIFCRLCFDAERHTAGLKMRGEFNRGCTQRGSSSANGTLPAGNRPVAAKIAVLSFVFVLATLGNYIFLYTLWRQRRNSSRTRLFLLHLCTADLAVAFFQVLPQLLWEVTDAVCKAVKYLQVVGMFASTSLLVAMTLDRHQAICQPMTAITKASWQIYLTVVMAWRFSLLFSLPQVFIFSIEEVQPRVFECWATFVKPWGRKTYITRTALVIFMIPAVILIVCQVKICRTIYLTGQTNRLKRIALTEANVQGAQASAAKRIPSSLLKTLKMMFLVVMLYILCWAPFFIVQLWSVWDPAGGPIEGTPFIIIMLLASLNSCTNPWIYMAFYQ
ncbi:vasopressin V2 receptor-like [Stegostoma tigrinum]|uniref:vasopressin V2 receptor-like n=1 Tax=Stegostoma tigrinum TaxID=3053191 RepID=UPI00202B0746|nr:vasopressin V2 receptor-like [Stegostoma tigrinum]